VTLRRLLKLDPYATHHPSDEIPGTWSGKNYDYFWIVDCADPTSSEPTKVNRQTDLHRADDDVPDNDWNEPEPPLKECVQ